MKYPFGMNNKVGSKHDSETIHSAMTLGKRLI